MKRLLLLTMFLLCLPLAMPARAALNYQDMWWLPSESGWGLMVLHQGNTISAVMFHYRADRKPAWYLLSNAQRGTEETFTGTLFEVTGPPLFGLFDPTTVLPRDVGTMTLRFTGPNEARLAYTIEGATTQRVIERISFATPDVDGIYFGAQAAVLRCNGSPQVGNYVFPAQVNVSGGAVRLTRVNDTLLASGGVACEWADTDFSQNGSYIRGQGNVVCRNGDSALVSFFTVEVEQMQVIDHAITINYRANVTYPTASTTCTERGTISGTRLVNPD
jgi:hypothetical protein